MLKRVGYSCPLSSKDIVGLIQKLPHYISGYDVVIEEFTQEQFTMIFSRRDKEGYLSIQLTKEEAQ